MTNTVILDVDELMHLALHATNQNQPDKAIYYLKQILEQNDSHAQSWYLLGALHAEIGMYERAIKEMSYAIKIDDNTLPPTAGFQLGLLYLTSGQIEEAEQTWAFLDALGKENSLYLFKRGMLHLVKNEFQAAIEDLNTGITLNKLNEELNNDMLRLVQTIRNSLNSNTENLVQATKTTKPQEGKRILLDAYQQQNYDDN